MTFVNTLNETNVRKGFEWSDDDFDSLSWNQSRLYGLILPRSSHIFRLYIDFVLQSPVTDQSNQDSWLLVKVHLDFMNVSNLFVNIDFKNILYADISQLRRELVGPSPNQLHDIFRYRLELYDIGWIELNATGFRQAAIASSRKIRNQDIDNESPSFDETFK